MIRPCPACGANNRVPAKHLADTGRCGSCKATLQPVSEPIEVDVTEFAEITREARVPILVDFWAEWCGPCRMIAPALEEISKTLNGKVKIVKLNVDENPGTAAKFGIMSIPTLMLFKDGQLASRQVGAAPKQKLEQWITAAV
jgi:thioredoxin 2